MKLGVLLPTFQDNADGGSGDGRGRAPRPGLDGVFAYDHLFPIGAPERPTLAPLPVLALVATRTPAGCGHAGRARRPRERRRPRSSSSTR